MHINKKWLGGLAALACTGILAGTSAPAFSATCSTPPIAVAQGNPALLPTTQRVAMLCTGNGTVEMESVGTVNGARVSARLIQGQEASVQGYNANRLRVSGCLATDRAPIDGVAAPSGGSCTGAVFKDLFVF
jgi:hypothetical protein